MTTPKTPQPLPGGAQPFSITLDGSGNGVAKGGPQMVRQHWQVAGAAVKVSTNNAEAICSLYVGTALSSATFLGSSFSGSTGDNFPIGGMDIQPGQQIFAQWSGGDPGATATLTVFGTYTTGPPDTFLSGTLAGFLNKFLPIFQAGQRVIINNKGFFIYNGTPSLGNLLLSETANAGVDAYGNAYKAGLNIYGSGGQVIQLNVSGGVPLESFFTGAASEAATAQLKAGFTGGQLQFIVAGATDTVFSDAVFMNLTATPHASASPFAKGFLVYQKPGGGGDQNMLSWGADGVFRASNQNMVGVVPLEQNDNFSRTANTVGPTALTFAYPIPANDPTFASNQQTTYEMYAWGNGTESNPATTGNFAVNLFGVNVYVSVLFATAGAGAAYTWFLHFWCIPNGNGTNQSAVIGGLFASAGNTAQITISGSAGGMNTTVPSTMVLNWGWNANNGMSITCIGSRFRRTGP